MFHRVSYKSFRRTENITELGGDYKEVGGLQECVTLEGLSGRLLGIPLTM